MKLKQNVRLEGISPIIVLALTIVANVFAEHGQDLVITSVTDGKHMEDSLHYAGRAADVRKPAYTHIHKLVDDIAIALGDSFDVVLEPTHIHIEYDPK